RLNTIELRLPALADRPADIGPLAELFLPAGKRLSPAARAALLAHAWPGNVRELKNCLQRAGLLSQDTLIEPDDLGLRHAAQANARIEPEAEPDRAAIEAALDRSGGVIAQAANELGLSRQALYRR